MDQNNTSFVKYCKKRLRKSSIRSIAKIANTRNLGRKAFKLIVFFMSVAGFFWQSYTFIKIYLEYPVVQYFTREYPEVINAPAVTLCNANRIKRQSLCKYWREGCNDYGKKAWNMFCNPRTKYCPVVQPKNYILSKYPKRSYMDLKWLPDIEVLQYLGPQSQRDLLENCTIERGGQSITCNDSMMIQMPYRGFPYRCFTFFSLLGEPKKDPENLSLTDYYSFRLNLHPEEDISFHHVPTAYVSVHDPRRLKNPFVEYIALTSGYSYRLYVTMRHIQSSPPPYETNCVDYVTLWKQNGGRGPLSRRDCIQVCMMNAMMDKQECLGRNIDYPTDLPNCYTDINYRLPEDLLTKCESSCHEGCDAIEYFMTYEIAENLKDKLCNETDVHCKLSYLDLEINFSRLTKERLISEPLFVNRIGRASLWYLGTDFGKIIEELFSHIYGYMGLWLGISLIALFDFVEMLIDIFMNSVIKWRKMNTRIVSYEDDKQNA